MLVNYHARRLKLAFCGKKEENSYCSGDVDGDNGGLSAHGGECCFVMMLALIVFTLG
jgi:hypothetical protein